jgi:hypothetical protein
MSGLLCECWLGGHSRPTLSAPPLNPFAPPRNAIYNLGQAQGYDFSRYMKDDFLHPNDLGHQVGGLSAAARPAGCARRPQRQSESMLQRCQYSVKPGCALPTAKLRA